MKDNRDNLIQREAGIAFWRVEHSKQFRFRPTKRLAIKL